MLDKTDRHYRYFARIMTKHALLYTEMVTTGAILKGDADHHLRYNNEEHPIALQLGGSDPSDMRQCAEIAARYGYDEVNINVGCPSDRVQSGMFGACLMAEPDRIADCVDQMASHTNIPVTVKTRIGIDDNDSYEALCDFVQTVSSAGCQTFIIHARKAWLQGLSPKENREIPPLKYDVVYQLKKDFPQLEIIINGGVKTLDEAEQHLQRVDGVMVGREAYSNAYLLADVDQRFYGVSGEPASRKTILTNLMPYIESEVNQGTAIKHITRHILGLFQGMPGARQWRRHLSGNQSLTIEKLQEMISTLN